MTTISFDKISKTFGENTVIREFSAEIGENEFLVLLGPSGCGKSTMLRMIAGLIDITSGQLRFGDRVVNDLSPRQRNIAFVFQSYALYPHMTVRENIAFPLVMDRFAWWWHLPFVSGFMRWKLSKGKEILNAVERTAGLLELSDYLERRPKDLSGGQRQRVAVARSIVREPAIYLLDEPLSNLDAKLRMQMRAEISALYHRVRKTFVYVTHDQVEAMTMGTRIIVLNGGIVQQFGTPKEIYERPANVFVARFIGSPAMNVFRIVVREGLVEVGGEPVAGSAELAARLSARGIHEADMGVRAEKVSVVDTAAEGVLSITAHVSVVEHLGAETVVGLHFGPPGTSTAVGAAASRGLNYARLPGEVLLEAEQPCRMAFSDTDVHVFDAESGERVEM